LQDIRSTTQQSLPAADVADRRMVRHLQRDAERQDREQRWVDETIIATFGWKLAPDEVVERVIERRAP
jgi:hypothetical protein